MKPQQLLKGCLFAGVLALVAGFETRAGAQTILVDFGQNLGTSVGTITPSPSSGNYWNNFSTGTTIALIDTTNAATGGNLTFTTGYAFNSSAMGVNTGDASLGNLNVSTAIMDAVFTTDAVTGNTFKLTNLNPAKTYTFKLFGSRSAIDPIRVTTYTATGGNSLSGNLTTSGTGIGTGSVNYNTGNFTTFVGITPDVNNEIFINYKVNSGGFAYLNALQIDVVPEPSTWALLAFSLTIVMVFRRRRRA